MKMAEIYFCPTCSEQINMNFAVCPQCGTDVSAITHVKSKSATKKVEEKEEDNEEEEEVPVKKSVAKEPVATTKTGSGIGRWLYAILTTAIIYGAVWLYNNYHSNPEIKKIISEVADKGKETYPDQTSSENKEVYSDPLTDAVNDESPVSVKLEDFIGEWQNVNDEFDGHEVIKQNNIVIKKDNAGKMFLVFKGYESNAENNNYAWSKFTGNKVTCISTSKKDSEEKGAIALELSTNKDLLTFSILDKVSMNVEESRKMKRVK